MPLLIAPASIESFAGWYQDVPSSPTFWFFMPTCSENTEAARPTLPSSPSCQPRGSPEPASLPMWLWTSARLAGLVVWSTAYPY